jgi:hypothetical protein
MSLSRIFLIIAVRRCGRSTSDVKTFAFFACSATPVNTCWVVRSRVGPGWEFLAALSRVSPFERMFVACLLLRHDEAHAGVLRVQTPFRVFKNLVLSRR